MMQKIREFAETVRAVIFWIVAPLLFIAGFVYYLLTQRELSVGSAERAEKEKKLEGMVKDAEDAVREANDAEADYRAIADKHKRSEG